MGIRIAVMLFVMFLLFHYSLQFLTGFSRTEVLLRFKSQCELNVLLANLLHYLPFSLLSVSMPEKFINLEKRHHLNLLHMSLQTDAYDGGIQ